MKRKETQLLLEEWRKVLKEGLYDEDPELLEEGFQDWMLKSLTAAMLFVGGSAAAAPVTKDQALKDLRAGITAIGGVSPKSLEDLSELISDVTQDNPEEDGEAFVKKVIKIVNKGGEHKSNTTNQVVKDVIKSVKKIRKSKLSKRDTKLSRADKSVQSMLGSHKEEYNQALKIKDPAKRSAALSKILKKVKSSK